MSRSREGFTLVELIVVIAILAILAGVGIPVYSGYIKKANEAADQQLLGVLNTAFGAACLENNLNASDIANGAVSFNVETMRPTMFEEDFAKYFANSGTFKVINALRFVNGVFVDGSLTPEQQAVLSYLKETYGEDGAEIDQWLESTFNTKIGAGKLLGQVDWVTGLATGAMVEGSTLWDIVDDEDYVLNLMTSLDMDEEEFFAMYDAKTEAEKSEFLANSLVLSVAQNTATNPALKKETLTTQLSDGSIKSMISSNLGNEGDPETALAQAAVAYGMYTSYANYIGDEKMIKNAAEMQSLTQLSGMLNDMYSIEDSEDVITFQEYMAGQGKDDLDGYLSALEMAGAAAEKDPSVALDVLNNGFGGLEGLLGGLSK
ncbi:MAG: prepilin-type N-terminal cleavage/methylation domain-containing protein [Oscillospiraceae bacterium]|nr:prepilin-type N-terminal cleavage/methylation domain-containing protein [Oscillospiraceae bacterium]